MREDITQIDIPIDLSERLTEAASDQGLLPWGLIRKLLDDAQWAQKLQTAKVAMSDPSPENWADYGAVEPFIEDLLISANVLHHPDRPVD